MSELELSEGEILLGQALLSAAINAGPARESKAAALAYGRKAVSPGGRPADDSPLAKTPEKDNWVDKAGGLPKYIRMVAHALIREHGYTESHAIATAVNRMKVWAASSNDPKVKTAATAALVEWNAKRGKARASKRDAARLELKRDRYVRSPEGVDRFHVGIGHRIGGFRFMNDAQIDKEWGASKRRYTYAPREHATLHESGDIVLSSRGSDQYEADVYASMNDSQAEELVDALAHAINGASTFNPDSDDWEVNDDTGLVDQKETSNGTRVGFDPTGNVVVQFRTGEDTPGRGYDEHELSNQEARELTNAVYSLMYEHRNGSAPPGDEINEDDDAGYEMELDPASGHAYIVVQTEAQSRRFGVPIGQTAWAPVEPDTKSDPGGFRFPKGQPAGAESSFRRVRTAGGDWTRVELKWKPYDKLRDGLRRVATLAGAAFYGVPVGTIIEADKVPKRDDRGTPQGKPRQVDPNAPRPAERAPYQRGMMSPGELPSGHHTEEVEAALESFDGDGHAAIQHVLHTDFEDPHYQAQIDAIDGAMAPIEEEIQTYRPIDDPVKVFGPVWSDTESMKGMVYQDPGYGIGTDDYQGQSKAKALTRQTAPEGTPAIGLDEGRVAFARGGLYEVTEDYGYSPEGIRQLDVQILPEDFARELESVGAPMARQNKGRAPLTDRQRELLHRAAGSPDGIIDVDKSDPDVKLLVESEYFNLDDRSDRAEITGRGMFKARTLKVKPPAPPKAAPVKKTPAKKAPAKAPVKRAPAKKPAPVKTAPVKRAPAKKAPATAKPTLSPTMRMRKSKKSRTTKAKGYPDRFPVPSVVAKADPARPWPEYRPVPYTADIVKAKSIEKMPEGGKPKDWWADPEDPRRAMARRKGGAFFSQEGPVTLDDQGRPVNPYTRTGIQGRGLLGKWGANQAADAVVTRYHPVTGQLQMRSIKRDDGSWAAPGGMVDDGEDAVTAMIREFKEETGADLDASQAKLVYQGYVDDPRNTDNAWMETTAAHMHLTAEQAAKLEGFKPENADEIQAVDWQDVTDEFLDSLYASHADFVRTATAGLPRKSQPVAKRTTKKAPAAPKRVKPEPGSSSLDIPEYKPRRGETPIPKEWDHLQTVSDFDGMTMEQIQQIPAGIYDALIRRASYNGRIEKTAKAEKYAREKAERWDERWAHAHHDHNHGDEHVGVRVPLTDAERASYSPGAWKPDPDYDVEEAARLRGSDYVSKMGKWYQDQIQLRKMSRQDIPKDWQEQAQRLGEEDARKAFKDEVTVYRNGPHVVYLSKKAGVTPAARAQFETYLDDMITSTDPRHKVIISIPPAEDMDSLGIVSFIGDHHIALSANLFRPEGLRPPTQAELDEHTKDRAKSALPDFKMPVSRRVPELQYVLAHEWGHTLDYRYEQGSAERLDAHLQKDDLFTNGHDALSMYGSKNPTEAYAEAFVEWYLNGGQSDNAVVAAYARRFGWKLRSA